MPHAIECLIFNPIDSLILCTAKYFLIHFTLWKELSVYLGHHFEGIKTQE